MAVNTIAFFMGLLSLCVIGWLDLRRREITWRWLYIIVLVCGLFTAGSWFVKAFSLIIIPLILMECAHIMAKHKTKKAAKAEGKPFDKSSVSFESAFSFFGGADILTIAVAGFLAGPYLLAASIVVGILLCSIPFMLKPTLGMKKALIDNKEAEYQGKQPFCFLVAVGMTVIGIVVMLLKIH